MINSHKSKNVLFVHQDKTVKVLPSLQQNVLNQCGVVVRVLDKTWEARVQILTES